MAWPFTRSAARSPAEPDTGNSIVLLDHLTKEYGEAAVPVLALHNVSLEIPKGEFVVFIGPSGSGKTTLLNIVGGLDQPTSGRAIVAGHDLSHLDEGALTRYRRDVVGFVFQFFNLVPTLTARENVELVAELSPNPMDGREALRMVGLEDRANHFPGTLSGGEQQRVAMARALVKRPALILADEPTGSLDFETGIRVLTMMRKITRELKQTAFLVTHNSEITRMADRVVRLRSGEIAEVSVNDAPVEPTELKW
jgi:putative ABC transport system ATP-binding protein